MSGATASVILRSPFTAGDTGLVSQLLRDHTTEVAETRKGRHWDFIDSGSRASLTVFETSGRADFHADLVGAGLSRMTRPRLLSSLTH